MNIVFRDISLAPLPVEEDRERDAARPPHRTLHQDVGVGRAEPLRAREVGEAAFVEHGAAAAALVALADHAQELGVAPAVTDHGLSGQTSAGHNETLSSLLACTQSADLAQYSTYAEQMAPGMFLRTRSCCDTLFSEGYR